CVGVDHRLVVDAAHRRCREALLRSAKSARRTRGRELRPVPAADQDSPQGDQGRLASVRTELLPPLSPGRAPCRADRYVDQPSRISVCRGDRELSRSSAKDQDRAGRTPNRRSILLGGTTLAASALAAAAPVAVAQAQPQPAPSGQRPNILVIWGDDIGI